MVEHVDGTPFTDSTDGWDNGGILRTPYRLSHSPQYPIVSWTPDQLAAYQRALEILEAHEQATPERTPSAAELNPWHGVAAIGLHTHTPDQSCDDTCSEY